MKKRYKVGIDVGGTFTKAVVVDGVDGSIVATASTPTTYRGRLGIARGILAALSKALNEGGVDPGSIERVTFTTTHNVNALLEGDLAKVGLIVLSRKEYEVRAKNATSMEKLEVAPGRKLEVVYKLVVHDGQLHSDEAEKVVREALMGGAEAIAVNEAFGVDDPSREKLVVDKARERGLPAIAGHELSMVYGLEVRTYTSVLNASVLPYMSRVTAAVREGVRRLGVEADIYVVRGDGSTSSVEILREKPILTVMSGPAASAVGATYWARLWSGVVVEAGGTTTNVIPVKWGLTPTSYLKILGKPTTVRAVDAEIVPVGGGSLPRLVNGKIAGVGPRSAHIAGLAYASFTDPEILNGARPVVTSPLPGDPKSYLILKTEGGLPVAITPTCAAAALGVEVPGARRDSARIAFEALEAALDLDWRSAAEGVLYAASSVIAESVKRAARRHGIDIKRYGVAGGGGAWFLAKIAARLLSVPFTRLDHAPFLSAAGAAVSLAGASIEIGVGGAFVSKLRQALEHLELQAGGDGFVVYTESDPPRKVLRVAAIEAPKMGSPLKDPLEAASEALGLDPDRLEIVYRGKRLMVVVAKRRRLPLVPGRFKAVVVDYWGRVYLAIHRADVYKGRRSDLVRILSTLKPMFMVAPAVYLIEDSRLIDFSLVYKHYELVESIDAYMLDVEDDACIIVRW